jgi:hypothetical protein
MNLEAVGNIAELISAIGVVATLGYLAVQIRQSSITTRANNYWRGNRLTMSGISSMNLICER